MNRDDLHRLSKEQLIELVLRLQRPQKTSRNSSKPPSTDKKAKRESSRPGGAKPGHEAHNRPLAENPDEYRDYHPEVCEQCGGRFEPDADEELIGEYDEIEIPPVKPYIIRHRRYTCRCGTCGLPDEAPAPAIAGTTPFGPRIHALAIYYKSFQALSYERLRFMFRDAFGLQVSDGRAEEHVLPEHGQSSPARRLRRAALFAPRGSSPATKPACVSKGPIPITGCSTARTRSFTNPTIPAPHGHAGSGAICAGNPEARSARAMVTERVELRANAAPLPVVLIQPDSNCPPDLSLTSLWAR